MCVRRPGPRELASILTVTHVTDARETRSPRLLSAENDMDPGPVPLCLEGLTRVEQMLIARGCQVMCVYRKKGGQRGYKNHVLNFPQDIQGFLDSLPSYVCDLPFLVVRRMGQDNSHRDFKVRRTRVYDALVWLRDNNRFYQDIHINMDAVSSLPEDGVPEELLTVEEQDDPDDPPAMPDSSVVDQIMTEIDESHFSQDSAASGDRQDQQEQHQQRQQQQLLLQAVMITEDNLETMSEGDMFSRSDHDDADYADDADDTEETLQTWILVLSYHCRCNRIERIQPSGLQSMGKIPWHGQMSVESQ